MNKKYFLFKTLLILATLFFISCPDDATDETGALSTISPPSWTHGTWTNGTNSQVITNVKFESGDVIIDDASRKSQVTLLGLTFTENVNNASNYTFTEVYSNTTNKYAFIKADESGLHIILTVTGGGATNVYHLYKDVPPESVVISPPRWIQGAWSNTNTTIEAEFDRFVFSNDNIVVSGFFNIRLGIDEGRMTFTQVTANETIYRYIMNITNTFEFTKVDDTHMTLKITIDERSEMYYFVKDEGGGGNPTNPPSVINPPTWIRGTWSNTNTTASSFTNFTFTENDIEDDTGSFKAVYNENTFTEDTNSETTYKFTIVDHGSSFIYEFIKESDTSISLQITPPGDGSKVYYVKVE